jgi:hypothetical protein
MRAAQSLRVGNYNFGNEWKVGVVDNTGEVKDLVSAFSVQGTLRCNVGIGCGTTIQFLLPSGEAMEVAFRTPTQLTLDGWGHITLRSRDFYDKIRELLSKREGKPVRFVEMNTANFLTDD